MAARTKRALEEGRKQGALIEVQDGETWLKALKRVQREYAGMGRTYVVQVKVP